MTPLAFLIEHRFTPCSRSKALDEGWLLESSGASARIVARRVGVPVAPVGQAWLVIARLLPTSPPNPAIVRPHLEWLLG
jgi:hypothetical protein